MFHECTHCDYKTTRKDSLTRHTRCKHNINTIWYHCDKENCNYKTTRKDNLTRHLEFVHDIGKHSRCKHNINPTWYHCKEDNCNHKTTRKDSLTKHLKCTHQINPTWYHCKEDNCNHKTTRKYNLTRHLEFVHDIGKHECSFCLSLRNSQNAYTDEHGTHQICNKCYAKSTGQQSRKETLWSNYLDEHLECPAIISDKNLKSIGGCILQRPDKLYTSTVYTELGECDEYEHLHKNGDYSCDENRITKIYDEEGIMGTHMNVLRWNPDNFKAPKGVKKPTFDERCEIYVALSQKLRKYSQKNILKNHIHIYYMFYSKDNPLLAKNIPYTILYSMKDVEQLEF